MTLLTKFRLTGLLLLVDFVLMAAGWSVAICSFLLLVIDHNGPLSFRWAMIGMGMTLASLALSRVIHWMLDRMRAEP